MFITPQIERLIDLALDEDLGAGDLTTDAIFSEQDQCSGTLLAKSELVLAGATIFEAVMFRFSPFIELQWHVEDGEKVAPGTALAHIEGPVSDVLRAERTALNFIQRMSGVATLTRRYAERLEGTHTDVVDTRKTLPGWRALDKYAVRAGGGRNHRFNLGSGVMIKDNHIAAAGSIAAAVQRVRRHAPHTTRVEVEIDDPAQLDEVIDSGADIIMLDNMDSPTMARLVKAGRARAGARPVIFEASGGITIERLAEIAETGVDVVSVGALTHSAIAVDISLDLETQLEP